ncbi:MAG TPA: hypothetical protein VKH35_06770 [Thermoanaerobaculia bacterium]|nr:hypothetical protein [Thermoanaerobaculia bacterium]
MALHLAVDVEAVGGAVDVAVLDEHPRLPQQIAQVCGGQPLLGRIDRHSRQDHRRGSSVRFDDDRAAVDHGRESRHRRRQAACSNKETDEDQG